MNAETAHIMGLIGSILVISAYWGLKLGKLNSDDLKFDVINLVGAVLLGASLLVNFNLGSMMIELFMGAAALYGIVKWCIKDRLFCRVRRDLGIWWLLVSDSMDNYSDQRIKEMEDKIYANRKLINDPTNTKVADPCEPKEHSKL